MNKVLATASTLSLMIFAGTAFASDLPSRKSAPVYVPPPIFSWTGYYAGLNLGADFPQSGYATGGQAHVNGGGQVGYNLQLSPLFVAGVETDFQGTSSGLNPWFGTVRARIGVTPFSPNLMFYGTGGFAYGGVNNNWAGWNGAFDNSSSVGTGWTAGGGVEWAFHPNWSVKAEYLYTNLSGNTWNNGWGGGYGQLRSHHIRLGVNYHFNMATPSPIFAKF